MNIFLWIIATVGVLFAGFVLFWIINRLFWKSAFRCFFEELEKYYNHKEEKRKE